MAILAYYSVSFTVSFFMVPKPVRARQPQPIITMGDGGKKRFIVEPHSPYFLHPSEGPGAVIMTVIFDGRNYELWEQTVTTALNAKNKLAFTNGTLMRPKAKDGEEFSECHAWDMVNLMLCSWLLNIIDPKLQLAIPYCDTALVCGKT